MLPHLSEIPFFRILVALAIGIASSYFSLFPSLAWWYWLLPIFIFSVSYFYRHALPYSQRWLLGLSVQISIALSGFILTSQFYSPNNRTDISHHHTGYTIVRITEAPSIKPKSINIYAATISNINNDTASTCTGNVFLRLPKTKAALELQYGEVLLVKNTFKPVNKPSNPGTFDFGYYLLSKNIQEVSYTDSNAWQSLGLGYQNLLFTWAYKVSNKALTAYKEFLPDTSSRSIVEALCIGERSELSPDINQAFIDTGTIHILSVSGMHVGLFFLVLTWGFARLLPKRELAWLSTLCILCVLWFYALLSGFSAPVIRATMMCTIVALGKLINRKGNVINTLCLSACIQLIINPFSLFDIGFQLSYMAVLSITVLTPGMLAWYSSQNKIIHTAYAACVVALAAQFGTLPLILYYFHRFPTYFLPANLATIAISNFIICGGLVLFVFSFIPSIAYLIGLALNLSSKLLLAILNYISHLPHATANEIFCNKVLFIAIFIVIIAVNMLIVYQNKAWLFTSLYSILLLIVISLSINFYSNTQHKLIVYHLGKNQIAIAEIQGNSMCVYSTMSQNSTLAQQNIEPTKHCFNIKSTQWIVLPARHHQYWKIPIANKNIVILNPNKKSLVADSILTNSLVIGKYISNYIAKHAKQTVCTYSKTPLANMHITNNDGAYITDL